MQQTPTNAPSTYLRAGFPRPRIERTCWGRRSAALSVCLVALAWLSCGGASMPAPESASPTPATWGAAELLAGAGYVPTLLYGGDAPPQVRLEGLPDGTAFALWDRTRPETVAAARFSGGTWEPPAEGPGMGVVHSWLAVSVSGRATIVWGENPPASPGRSLWPWARRFVPGRGWLEPERLQAAISRFDYCCTIGANPPTPAIGTSVVMSDAGDAQAFWNRGYPSSTFSPTDVYSSLATSSSDWSADSRLYADAHVDFARVSRRTTLAYWSAGSRFQVFDASRGWQEPGASPFPSFSKIVPAGSSFVGLSLVQYGSPVTVRALDLSGALGPVETLIANYLGEGHDVCGNEQGVFAFVRSEDGGIVLSYRAPSMTPPSYVTARVVVPGRPATEPVTCHVDGAGRVLVVWRSGSSTIADRYAPGRGFEGTRSIGPGYASTTVVRTQPAFAEDSQGNILVVWSIVVSPTKNVEIWWNRFRVP